MFTHVVPHDPCWAEAASQEIAAVRTAGAGIRVIHHIGSTAIPGILAKPIIDLLGEARDLSEIKSPALKTLGYEAMGAYGITGRRYFRKTTGSGVRTHHLHVFAQGSPHIIRHVAFREYLRAHPEVAAAYSALKARLMGEGAVPWETYMDGKDPFVRAVEADACAWYGARPDG